MIETRESLGNLPPAAYLEKLDSSSLELWDQWGSGEDHFDYLEKGRV
ncbi:hypothetical protein [Alteromonas stellipolaris]|nr:hypothetical protein [Alteromonas stellipolaris]